MANTLKVAAQKRWWVDPLLSVLKAFAYVRIVKEKHTKPISDFLARWGFKFKAEN